MSANENLEKAYTASATLAGTNWAGSAASDSLRDQLDDSVSGSGNVHLTDPVRRYLLDRVVNEAVLLGMIRKHPMARSRVEIPRMSVGTRIARAGAAGGHPENTTAGAAVAPDFDTNVLTSAKIVLPWEVSEEFFEDNPELGAAEQLIIDMMATQLANDLEDVAVNGDEASGDALLRANNGFTALGASANVKDFNGAAFTTNTLELMLRTMPTKYRRDKSRLRFIVPTNMEMDLVQTYAARMGDWGDSFMASGASATVNYGGIPVIACTKLPDNGNANGGSNEYTAYLTDPENLVFGVQRDIKLRKADTGKNAIDLDKRYYALHIRSDFLIQNTEAFVLGKEITPRVA